MNMNRGFSLIEMAIVLVVIVLLLGGALVPLTTQVQQARISETETKLDEIKEALIGYAIANGRIPCPASATSNGVESFAAGGNPTNGNCSNPFDGFIPAVTLGLTQLDGEGYAVDGWGFAQNRIRYAVSNHTVNSVTRPFTRTDGMRMAGMSNLASSSAPLLFVCSSASAIIPGPLPPGPSCGAGAELSSKAPAVIYSVGKNAAEPTGGSGPDEAQNPNPNGGSANRFFVSHIKSEGNAPGGEFDDIVTWLSTNVLFNRMVAAGRLP
jgi:prepilin-type N-terminal cleavage/methylation domain-containing protein